MHWNSIATFICIISFSGIALCQIKYAPTDIDQYWKAQVIADDLIAQGSNCIGIDCSSGENFGFDTQRFKENNLRIHFDDTSNSASFPGNDWRILINDSENGGANYFAIQDATAVRTIFRIDAGAPSNTLKIKNNGNIGIGTSNPVLDLHVTSDNTPGIRLEQIASAWSGYVWDISGNETNFFIRDVNNGSALPFRIMANTPNKTMILSSEKITFFNGNKATIDKNGNIAAGHAMPLAKMHIKASTTDTLIFIAEDSSNQKVFTVGTDDIHFFTGDMFTLTSDGSMGIGATDIAAPLHIRHEIDNVAFKISEADSSNHTQLIVKNGKLGIGTDNPTHALHIEGDIAKSGAIYGLSDKRLKTQIQDIDKALKTITQLNGKKYQYKTEAYSEFNLPTGIQYGLIAQEVAKVDPNLVQHNIMTSENGMAFMGVQYEAIIPLLINAIKQQQKIINQLKEDNYDIKLKLSQRLERLEGTISQLLSSHEGLSLAP